MNAVYPACLTLHRLHLSVKLGRWDDERARLQPVEVSIKFFFPEPPAACAEDTADVFCYDELAAALAEFVQEREFLHIEYLAAQLHAAIRAQMHRQMQGAYEAVRVWVKLHKIGAPIPSLIGGASFVYTDLPEGAAIAHE